MKQGPPPPPPLLTGGGNSWNVAVTVLSELVVAVSVTDVPVSYIAMQLLPQLIPAGAELTLPLPEPVRLTVRLCWMRTNSATADRALSINTVQTLDDPLQALLHPL